MYVLIHVTEYHWRDGILTACFKSVLLCVTFLTRKHCNSERIDYYSDTLIFYTKIFSLTLTQKLSMEKSEEL